MFGYLKTGLTIFNVVSRTVVAGKIIATVSNFVPKEKRAKILNGVLSLKDTSETAILKFLEKQSPGFIKKVVERNGGQPVTKEDLEQFVNTLKAGKAAAAAPAKATSRKGKKSASASL